VYHYPHRHGVVRPVIMDATVPQLDGYRFAYLLPLSATELLIEDTYYASSSLLDRDAIGARLDGLAATVATGPSEVISEENGVLPVLVEGTLDQLWPAADGVPRLGLAGGFFHPTTGYSLPDALANAMLLAEQEDLSAAAVCRLLRTRAERTWQERHFFQLLNRMLFRAAEPERRYRVLEHFYRLPPALISRFYAAKLSRLDKVRILSGRPPVPLVRALSALFRKAA
jgi:lycopene beta-cyclase